MEDNQTVQLPLLPEDCVFALDIGTRSVIGIVGRQRDQLFEVLAAEMREHPQRAMVDGQIEDIRQVARVAGSVKIALEERLGFSLNRVNVAAAGRALKTGRSDFAMDLPAEPVTSRQVYDLEMGAISRIREQVAEQNDDSLNYYCVGHSVVRYYLDEYPFSTIIGHKGTRARADVIATFLPAEVVDSLCAAMSIIGCEIAHLTLEPIAAMNAVIPAELRLLNLALVDIGAGTSDIAISENGSVSAYTMATVAGDEVTEELIRRYLVDFQTAERMKHEAAEGKEEIAYQDILGFEYCIPLKELMTALHPAVDGLASVICDKIREANGKPPAAVFLVGGGSLVPMLCDCVADGLELDRKKVAVGGNNFIKRVAAGMEEVTGPEFATPLGIALTAVAEGSQHGFYLLINGKKTRIFRNENITVMDSLLLCGYQYHQLLGHNGRSITYQFNGQKQILRGGYLTPAQILLNGLEASLTAPVSNEDRIDVIPAVDGEDAALTLTLLEADPFEITVYLNGMPLQAGREVTVNGQSAQPGQEILDRDIIVTREILTLGDLCAQLGVAKNAFLLNGESVPLETNLCDGDQLEPLPSTHHTVEQTTAESPQLSKEAQEPQAEECPPPEEALSAESVTPVEATSEEPKAPSAISPALSEETPQSPVVEKREEAESPKSLSWAEKIVQAWELPVPIRENPPKEPTGGQAVSGEPQPSPSSVENTAPTQQPSFSAQSWGLRQGIKITLNGETVWLDPKPQGGYQFLDMLNLVDIDPTKPQGNIVLRLNGRNASYLDDIRNGDTVDIHWDTISS